MSELDIHPEEIDTKLIIKFAIFACICDFLAFLDSLHIINLDERRLINGGSF